MVKRIAILATLFIACCSANATMTLVKRELFANGTLVSTNVGQFTAVTGTLNARAGGPYVSPETNGFSCDPETTSLATFGTIGVSASSNAWMACGWFFIRSVSASGGNEYPVIWLGQNSNVSIRYAGANNGLAASTQFIATNTTNLDASLWQNKWLFLAIAVTNRGSSRYDVKYYYATTPSTLTNWYTITNVGTYATPNTVGFGLAGANTPIKFRFGGCAAYYLSSFADVAYPNDLSAPVLPMTWYVNPDTGNDTNNGISSSTAWKTIGKVNTASTYCGFFPSTAYSSGDTLTFDTSTSQIDLAGVALVLQTEGLNVQPASGQTWITTKAFHSLTNSAFSLATGLAKTYQTSDTQTNITVWENDLWLNHPSGASWAAVSNSVEITAGSFWTDGTTLYLHPFGDTDPPSDSKTYTRSYAFSGAGAAININSSPFNVGGFYVQKTALINKSDNTDGVGTTGISVGGTQGGTCILHNCYSDYAGKHAIGLLMDCSNSDITVQDCQGEQCPPTVSASVWVSYMAGVTSTNNTHRYVRCKTLNALGAVGSSTGTNTVQSCIYSHNNGTGTQWSYFYVSNCFMPKGVVSLGPGTNLVVSGGQLGAVVASCPTTTIDRVLFDYNAWSLPYAPSNINFSVRNSIIRPQLALQAGIFLGGEVKGTVGLTNCTFDFREIPSADNPYRGILNRVGPASLTLQNCAFVTGSGQQYSVYMNFTNTDTIVGKNNVFLLGSSNIVAYAYGGANKTWSQWQALNFDLTSLVGSPCIDTLYRPYSKTPCWTTGAELGPAVDYTGKLFQSRRTCGAYEYAPNPLMLVLP